MAKKNAGSHKLILPLLLLGFGIIATLSVLGPTYYKNQAAGGAAVYTGVYTENDENDFSRVTAFENAVGKPVSLVMFFHYWNEGNFPYDLMNRIRTHGSIPVVSWESYEGSDQVDSSWGGIAKGVKDEYIRQWARDSKTWGTPYFLRLDWEMNGYWEPYASQYEQFVPMWKHVHDIFQQEGATNVTWVWCPNVEGYATRTIDVFYPGSDYVNWVCMDGYNFGTSQQGSTWQSFYDLFAATYAKLGKIAPGKPIMIGEFSSSEAGGDKAAWIKDALSDNIPVSYPNIKAIVWFDINKEADWRATSSENARSAFASAMALPYYAANQFATLYDSPIQPLSPMGGGNPIRIVPPTVTAVPATKVPPSATPAPTTLPSPSVIQESPTVFIECTPEECGRSSHLEAYLGIGAIFVSIFLGVMGGMYYFKRKKANKKK